MKVKCLRLNEVAEMLALKPQAALRLLKAKNIPYIDYGVGAYKGKRWLESDIIDLLHSLRGNNKESKKVTAPPISHLAHMSSDALFELTKSTPVQ